MAEICRAPYPNALDLIVGLLYPISYTCILVAKVDFRRIDASSVKKCIKSCKSHYDCHDQVTIGHLDH